MTVMQATKQTLRRYRDIYLMHPGKECCADCLRVRQRAAASCDGRAAWNEDWELISTRRLEALEQGHPLPPMTLPYLELQLPEGMPEELPPSLDRCSACQGMLDEVRLCGLWQPLCSRLQGQGSGSVLCMTRLRSLSSCAGGTQKLAS